MGWGGTKFTDHEQAVFRPTPYPPHEILRRYEVANKRSALATRHSTSLVRDANASNRCANHAVNPPTA